MTSQKRGYSPPLQVVEFIATRKGDPERGPMVRIRPDDAIERLLENGELAWIYGPRRHELVEIVVDDRVPRGGVVVRDVSGVAPSEIVRIIKRDFHKSHVQGLG
jgi:anaerobic selenocysteine-containing dehydrogenase